MGIRYFIRRLTPSESPSELAYRRSWLFVAWLMVAFVVWASLVPQPPQPPEFLDWDKAQHFAAYAVLTYWFGSILGPTVLCPVLLACMGIGLEYLQDLGGVRVMDSFDMLANALGAFAGSALAATRVGRFLIRVDGLIARILGP
jgi:VanZ family protein